MAFPVLVSSGTVQTFASGTSYSLALPRTAVAGDIIIGIMMPNAAGPATAGTQACGSLTGTIINRSSTATSRMNAYSWVSAAGGETSINFSFGSAITGAICFAALMISGALQYEVSFDNPATTVNPDPSAITASWGATDNLFATVVTFAGSLTAYGSTYTDNHANYPSGTALTITIASLNSTSATGNNGAFTYTPTRIPAMLNFVFKPSVTVVTTNKSVLATVTSSVTLSKSALKILSAVLSGSVSNKKDVSHKVPVTASTSVLIVAGRALMQSIAASCSTVVGVVRSVGKQSAASLASSVIWKRGIGKFVAVGASSVVVWVKNTNFLRSVSTTLSSSVSVLAIKVFIRNVLATCSTAVTVARGISKIVAAPISSVVAWQKAVAKKVSASITSTTVWAAGRQYARVVAAAIASTTVWKRTVGKIVLPSLTSTVTVRKGVSLKVAVAASTVVSVIMNATLSFFGALVITVEAAVIATAYFGKLWKDNTDIPQTWNDTTENSPWTQQFPGDGNWTKED